MTTYGVVPTGFARKPLSVILEEIEAANRVAFGNGVIQDAESPLGQLNGVFAEASAKLWENAEGAYQSYDPDQAEGTRLEVLARLRLLERALGESDAAFRQAITNAGRARIDMADLVRAIRGITGVTYAAAFVNDSNATDANGIAPHSVSVAVLGGDDALIAQAIRTYVVPGVGTDGNTRSDINVDGLCRTIFFTRPTIKRVVLSLTVSVSADRNGCPPPSAVAMKTAIVEELSGDAQPLNGFDVTMHLLRTALSCRFPNVEVVSGQAAVFGDPLASLPLTIPFEWIAAFAVADITIAVV